LSPAALKSAVQPLTNAYFATRGGFENTSSRQHPANGYNLEQQLLLL